MPDQNKIDEGTASLVRLILFNLVFIALAALTGAMGNWLLGFAVDWTFGQWFLASGWGLGLINAANKLGDLEKKWS